MNVLMEMPPRSRLYSLLPLGMGTAFGESLTSYINRMAWTYRVSSRLLVTQEILPHLKESYHIQSSPEQLGKFGRSRAMCLNGAGPVALDWSMTLEQLTMRSDLRNLTAHLWADGLPPRGLLRATPSWCPLCYQEWQEHGRPLYQPLLWMLQVMEVCLAHKKRLEERCFRCQKRQSAIAVWTLPGHCTQCNAWLGTTCSPTPQGEIGDALLERHQWAVKALEELRQEKANAGSLPWEKLLTGLATAVEIVGSARRFARMADLSKCLPTNWINHKQVPSLEMVLTSCYTLGITPFQLIIADRQQLEKTLQSQPLRRSHSSQSRRKHTAAHRERASLLIQEVLDGRRVPLGVYQIARLLDMSPRTLGCWFPHECAQVSAQYRTYRAVCKSQRIAQVCQRVRQAAFTLHEQGVRPTNARVKNLLPDPNMIREPAALATLHTVLRELEIDTERQQET